MELLTNSTALILSDDLGLSSRLKLAKTNFVRSLFLQKKLVENVSLHRIQKNLSVIYLDI